MATVLDDQRRHAKAGHFVLLNSVRALAKPYLWDSTMDSLEVLGLLERWRPPEKKDEGSSPKVARTFCGQQFWLARCAG